MPSGADRKQYQIVAIVQPAERVDRLTVVHVIAGCTDKWPEMAECPNLLTGQQSTLPIQTSDPLLSRHCAKCKEVRQILYC